MLPSHSSGTRNNIHIIDLAQTVPALYRALQAVSDTVAKGGRVLIVGHQSVKRQDAVADAARRSALVLCQCPLARRALLTNWEDDSPARSRDCARSTRSIEGGGQGADQRKSA